MTQPPTPEQPTAPHGQPTPAPKRKKWPWIAAAAIVVVMVIAAIAVTVTASGEPKPAAATSAPTTTNAISDAAQIECVNIDRAYNAWDTSDRAKTAEQVAALNEFTIEWEMDDGKVLAGQVDGYSDQPAKELMLSVSAYNYELSVANLSLTIGGAVDDDDAAAVAAAVAKMDIDYAAWKAATCGS